MEIFIIITKTNQIYSKDLYTGKFELKYEQKIDPEISNKNKQKKIKKFRTKINNKKIWTKNQPRKSRKINPENQFEQKSRKINPENQEKSTQKNQHNSTQKFEQKYQQKIKNSRTKTQKIRKLKNKNPEIIRT